MKRFRDLEKLAKKTESSSTFLRSFKDKSNSEEPFLKKIMYNEVPKLKIKMI